MQTEHLWLDDDGGLWLRQGPKGMGRHLRIGNIERSTAWPESKGPRPDWFAAEVERLKIDWADTATRFGGPSDSVFVCFDDDKRLKPRKESEGKNERSGTHDHH